MGLFGLFGKKDKTEENEEEVVCEDCGNDHRNKKVIAGAAEELTDEIFPEAWKELKEELKSNSKKEIAEQMFFLGAVHAMQMTQEMVKYVVEEAERDAKYFALPNDKKYEYLLTCEEEPKCEFSNFGMELEKKGEFEKAEKLYKREAELYSEDFSGYENTGRLYAKMKKFDLAEHNLKNALKLAMQQKEEDPNCIDDEVIDEIRKDLEEVKNAKG